MARAATAAARRVSAIAFSLTVTLRARPRRAPPRLTRHARAHARNQPNRNPGRAQGEDDGTAVVPAAEWLASREGAQPTGVYAVYDARRALQRVSYSRNCVLAVRTHLVRRRARGRAAATAPRPHVPQSGA